MSIETVTAKMRVGLKMRLINDHFSPTSAPFSAMVYLEPKLLRFQGLICRIYHFCDLLSCEDIVKNVRNVISGKSHFCCYSL